MHGNQSSLISGQALGGLVGSLTVPKQLMVNQADNGYIISDNFNYDGLKKVATDFDSMVAILREYFL